MIRKTILKTLIITFIIGALIGISAVLFDLWNDVTEKVLESTVDIFVFSVLGLACSLNYEKSENKLVSTIGMAICSISCIYFLLLILEILKLDFWELSWKFTLSNILLSVSFAHICLLLLIDSSNKNVKYFKNGTIGLSIFMDLLFLIEIYAEIEIRWKLLLVVAILIALGTVVTPLLNKLTSKVFIKEKDNKEDNYKKIEQLKKLLDDNAITKEEYEKEKSKILNS